MSTSTSKAPASSHRTEWVKLRAAGTSYREIGERYGYSHEAVRLVVDEKPGTRSTRAASVRADRAAAVREWVEANAPVQRDQVLAEFGLNARQLIYLTDADPEFPTHLIMQHSRVKEQTYSNDDVYASLREVWSKIKAERPDLSGMAHTTYDRFRGSTDPSPARVIGRWGSWELACTEAGVPHGHGGRPKGSYESRWSDAEILDTVGRFLADIEARRQRPTYAAYDAWQRDQGDCPSGTTLRLRARQLGASAWPEIVRAAAEVRDRLGLGDPDEPEDP